MSARIYNGAGLRNDVEYRDACPINYRFRRPETPVGTNDWDAVLQYGKEWGPAVAAESKWAWAQMYISGLGSDEAMLSPDVTVTTIAVKDRHLQFTDPKSRPSDNEVVEKKFDEGWTIRRLYDTELRPEQFGDIRHDVALAVGRLVLTRRGKFLFLGDHGMAGTDDQYRLDSLLLDPVKVASFKPRKDSNKLDTQVLEHYRDDRLPSAETLRARAAVPAFTRMDYNGAVITPEKIAKGAMEDLTPRMVVAGLRDFLKRYRMIRWSA